MDEEKEVWNNKNGQWFATNKALKPNMKHGDTITDYKTAAELLGYTTMLGEYYITRKNGEVFK